MNTLQSVLSRVKKSVVSVGFLAVVFSQPAVFAGATVATVAFVAPVAVHAGVPVAETASIPTTIKELLIVIKEALITGGKVAIRNSLRAFLEKIAYDSAVALASLGENQTPVINTKSVIDYLESAGDAALGEFLNSLATENGMIDLDLCDLPTIDSIHLQLLLPKLMGVDPYTPQCTWSEIKDSVSDYAESFQDQWRLIMEDPSAFFDLSVKFDDGNSALAALMNTWSKASTEKFDAEHAADIERTKSDFNDVKQDVSGYVKTPSSIFEMQTQTVFDKSSEGETTFTDNIVADAFTVFGRTLTAKLMDRIGSGIIDFFTSTDINDSISGSSATASAGAGIAGAEEQYASFKTASFNAGGTIDILTQFVSCPEEGGDVINCIISEGFRLAIEEQLTVQQAIDQGLVAPETEFAFDSTGAPIEDPSAGIPYRSMEVLKQYNVVPVGWVLAAEYNKDFDGTPLTLQTLIDDFDKCDVTDYSPYCGLVDPAWTLKAPEAYCKVQGYGETLADRSFEDVDGSDYTPDAELVSRLSTCVDTQSCLTESDTGQCEAYGYCTQQEDIYRFEGDSCPAYMASCDTYTDSEENPLAYLSNTLNFNDCSVDNAGCQWYCTVYNDVDEAFQCAGQGAIYTTCSTDGGCSCTVSSETCTVTNGGFQCTTDSDYTCTLGTQSDATSGIDSAISFDDDVTPCDSASSGCTEFITVKNGANVLFNASFEDFNSYQEVSTEALAELADEASTETDFPYNDTFGFYDADGDGAACTATSGTQECIGWQFIGGATARAVSTSDDGSVAAQFDDAGAGYVSAVFETGQALANRSFELTYSYNNPSAAECDGEYWIRPDDGSTTPAAIAITYYNTGVFTTNDPQIFTFPSTVTETAVRVGITSPAGCNLIIDSAKLEENQSDSGFTAYGDSAALVYVNMSEAESCDPSEVGCTLYTPITGESDIAVPGIITNPLSTVCGDGDDFSDPACSQCEEQYVGCDAYIPEPTPYSAPINTVAYFTDPLTIDSGLAAGIAQRTGYYCEGTETACSPEREVLDCGATAQCLPSISIIPDTGTSCSAAAVGCEEYVNIDEAAAGGEGLEYYTYIRQCVKETQDQIDADEVDTFYTFEGDDVSGYQIRSWYLKQSDVDNGPCTSLDLYGSTAETSEADCVDSTAGQDTCTAADIGTDPDCTEYYDDAGAVYYRLKSTTITVSDECLGLRNSLDDRLYYSIPSESTSCSAESNLCREYKGSEGGSVYNIIEENFDTSVWTQGESSSTVTTASSGQSMAVGAGTTNAYTSAYTDLSGVVAESNSYVVTFWAKASESDVVISPYFSSGATVDPFDDGAISLSTEWEQYQAGPYVFDTVNGDEQFGFTVASSTSSTTYIVYIDNVTLSQSDSYYLIAGSSDLCDGYEGCEEYSDSAGNTNYLKSFVSLCDESDVGCQALIATHDSETPYYTEYNGDNEYTEDDVVIDEDAVQTVVVNDDVLCDSSVSSCIAAGLPDLDANEDVESFETTYLLNDPDEYDTILCQEQQRSCEEFSNQDGEIVYFKDPGNKYCEYNSADGEWQTPDGDACPLQNSDTSAAPSQPKGPICDGGVRSGELCSSDAQCPNSDGTTLSRCVSNQDENSGWAGVCGDAYAGCTLYVDPNPVSIVDNSQFETDVEDNSDVTVGEPDGIPDDWTVLSDGASAGSRTANAFTFTDITNATVDTAFPYSAQMFLGNEGDSFSGVFYSGYFRSGSTTFTDYDAGNPSSAEPLLIYAGASTWNGYDGQTVTITTDSDTLVITLPTISNTTITDSVAGFYVDENGALYWADSGHNGIKLDLSDMLSPTAALTEANIVDPAAFVGSVDVNGFYDATDTGGTVGCTTFAQATTPVFDRVSALQLQADSANYSHCMVATQVLNVDANAPHSLSGNVYLSDANDEFAIGLVYFDADGNELTSSADPSGYAIAAYAGGTRSTDALATGEWLHFYGDIGPNLTHTFPEGTYYVKVFLEVSNTGTTSSVYFDNITFGEDDQYTYIADTVDGSGQGETNSCNGEIDIANGCVAFRDTTSNDLTYLSTIDEEQTVNSAFAVTSCEFNSGIDSETCEARPNTADSNVVIKVQNDRQCSEWLTCTYPRYTYNTDGEVTSTICLQIGRCTERNPDTGVCIEFAQAVDSASLGYEDDVSAVSQPGNVDDLIDIQDLAGYSTVGASWEGVCSSSICVGGASDGAACSSNTDCATAQVEYGYYSPENMTQEGSSGSSSSEDIVAEGDFEDVYCNGTGTYESGLSYSETSADGSTTTTIDFDDRLAELETQRDKGLTCTLDAQCRTTATEAKIESMLDTADISRSIDGIWYSEGWCSNVDQSSFAWGTSSEWTRTGDSGMMIIDYDAGTINGAEYTVATSSDSEAIQGDTYATAYGSGALDLNNVMLVTPGSNDDGGIQVDLGTEIIQGQDYVVSFDAQYMQSASDSDYMQVGIAHGTGSGTSNVDYFEQGTAMADIVFIVDASSSMEDEIDNAADAVSSLVTNLEEAGINYQTAIVTTGVDEAPMALDFDDYSSSGSTTNYGAADGTTRDFTSDSEEFSDAMSYIADNLEGGYVHNYEALVDVANGTLQDGHELGFRSGAMKFVILLTDTAPENDSYTGGVSWSSESEETAIMSTLGTPYIMYGILSGTDDTIDSDTYVESDAYDQLIPNLGGSYYDISSTDYSTMLAAISADMANVVSEFRFSTDYERYTLGPITIAEKEDADSDSFLFIRQVEGSANIPFVIDNVSLKPALEVNKENNINSDNSTWLISRDCRNYPDTDSRSCDYQDSSGTIYQGWKGYCLQQDVDLSSTPDFDESSRCVAWWPVDVISGEPDNTPREKIQYSGKYPVYQCLVAKGNSSISVCYSTTDGTDGLLCSSDSDCTGGVCVGNSDSLSDDQAVRYGSSSGTYHSSGTASENTYTLDSSYSIANYVMKHTFTSFSLDAFDPHIDVDGSPYQLELEGDEYEAAFFHEFTDADIPVESSIHISEIDDIHFWMGTPSVSSSRVTGGVSSDDLVEAKNTWYAGPDDFNMRTDLQTQSSQMFVHDEELLTSSDSAPDSAEGWFFQCGGDGSDPDCMAVYSYQKAAWCGSEACDSGSTAAEWDDADFTFVKAIMPKTEDATLDTNIDSVLEDEQDPFDQLSDLTSSANTWSDKSGKGDSGHIRGGNYVGDNAFSNFFQSEQTSNSDFTEEPSAYSFSAGSKNSCFGAGGTTSCGANIVGVKFDFDNGYLQSVYVFYWGGMKNVDYEKITTPYWEFSLREPCLLAVESVDENASTTPWMTRATSSTSYAIPGIGLLYDMDDVGSVFGSLTMDSDIPVTATDDYAAFDGVDAEWTAANFDYVTGTASTLPYVQLDGAVGTGVPFACVGSCAASVCTGTNGGGFDVDGGSNDNDYYSTYDPNGTCSQPVIGVYGVCSQHAQFCSTDDDCPLAGDGGETCEQGDWSNEGTSGDTYTEQVTNAAATAWERYRQVFPTLGGGPTKLSLSDLYYAANDATVSSTEFAYDALFSKTTVSSSPFADAFDEDNDNTYDFEDMRECTSTRDDTDYCYIKPVVSNILVNNSLSGDLENIASGSFVSLQFDSAVDNDQEPLQTISVEWKGNPASASFNSSSTVVPDPWEAASTTGHSYAYAYTCDPTDPTYWDSTHQACAYELRIQIEDNWGFCSGDTATTRTRSTDGACTSYTAYDGIIYVTP